MLSDFAWSCFQHDCWKLNTGMCHRCLGVYQGQVREGCLGNGCSGRWGGQLCLGLSVKVKTEYLGQKFMIILADDESITENNSMSGNKYRRSGLAFITEHLRSANDLKRHSKRDLKGKWQYQICFQFSSASLELNLKNEGKYLHIRSMVIAQCLGKERNFGLHLLLAAAFDWNFVACD